MPKTILTGQGTTIREKEVYDLSGSGPEEDIELSQQAFMRFKSPDERRGDFARTARDRLMTEGYPDPLDERVHLELYAADGEDSLPYFLASWLFEYRRVELFRGQAESSAGRHSMLELIECSVSLGRLEGRFGFLQQKDPITGRLWGEMALSAKSHHTKSEYGRNGAIQNAFLAKHGDDLVARAEAYFRRKPNAKISEFIRHVRKNYPVEGDGSKEEEDRLYSERTLRRALRDKKIGTKPPAVTMSLSDKGHMENVTRG